MKNGTNIRNPCFCTIFQKRGTNKPLSKKVMEKKRLAKLGLEESNEPSEIFDVNGSPRRQPIFSDTARSNGSLNKRSETPTPAPVGSLKRLLPTLTDPVPLQSEDDVQVTLQTKVENVFQMH